MNLRKMSVTFVVIAMVSIGFGNIVSDNARADFIEPLSNNGLPANFVASDTAWNEAGTMAVVVGYDSAGIESNAYAYWPGNDTYTPIDNQGYNNQRLQAVDYFNEPVYDWPNVLLVDADWNEDGLINYYENVFNNVQVYVDVWDCWDNPSIDQDKPTANDLADYDMVVWIPSRYMDGWNGPGDALNSNDMDEISTYLDNGGNFFLSNSCISDYLSFGPGNFPYDYLGLDYCNVIDSEYEYYVRPSSGDSVFNGMPTFYQDWWNYGWSGTPYVVDLFMPSTGTICLQSRDSMSNWDDTGIRYDSGNFKSMYLSFPLETLYPEDASVLMEMAVDWFCPSFQGTVDQSNEIYTNTGYVDAADSYNPFAQSFVPTADNVAGIELYMYADSVGDSFTIEICEDAGGIPGASLEYGEITAGDISTSPGWVLCEINNGGVEVTPGLTYWMYIYRNDFTDIQNIMVDYDNSYTMGDAMDYYNPSWGSTGYDLIFREYSSLVAGEPQTLILNPTKDTTIYSNDYSASNGGGEYLLVGEDYSSYYYHSLLEFDIGNIPQYSTITSASLELYCYNYQDGSSYETSLFSIYNEWGEGYNDAPSDEMWGDFADTGDATWEYRLYSSDYWDNYGGDFSGSSTQTWVSTNGWYSWSGSAMVDTVQSWIDDPSQNNGWGLLSDVGMGSLKWYYSSDCADPLYWPKLTITYVEPEPIGYRDVFWVAGDTIGGPPSTCYKIIPSEGMDLISAGGIGVSFYAMAVDDMGNPLCAGYSLSYMYYYDGTNWLIIDCSEDLTMYIFDGMDFNPNDRRFYAVGIGVIFYTDSVPFDGSSQCYRSDYFTGYDDFYALAWNENYDYGLAVEQSRLLKIWPYDEYNNGTIRYEVIADDSMYNFYDVSWDTDGWNEAGIVGYKGGVLMGAYWRYYHTNPQLLEGYIGTVGGDYYFTCAFKPPSSPKWLFVPLAGGSLRVNVEAKDESGTLTVGADQPHIFTVDMWKQVDFAKASLLNTQVDADATYTFFIEGNYTVGGVDHWNDLEIDLTAWYDNFAVGAASVPGDPTWSLDNYRTRQFNISYDPSSGMDTMLYPVVGGASPEFEVQDVWQDPVNYGPDGSWYRLYMNVTFGAQTYVADSSFAQGASADPYDINNALLDSDSWDFSVTAFNTLATSARNISYEEFGINTYASISVSGNPGGSAPPGTTNYALSTPSQITYSTNAQYFVNVSIPNLLKDGTGPQSIGAFNVAVENTHSSATIGNSEMVGMTNFLGAGSSLCVWGISGPSVPISPAFNGTITAGPEYSDYTADFLAEAFEVTEVYWWVTIPASTAEGTYTATITMTLWGG